MNRIAGKGWAKRKTAALVITTLGLLTGCATGSQPGGSSGGLASLGALSSAVVMQGVLGSEGDMAGRLKGAALDQANDQVAELAQTSDDVLRTWSALALAVPPESVTISQRQLRGGATVFVASTAQGRVFFCEVDVRRVNAGEMSPVNCERR